jgi:hypothetical protein
LTIAFIERPAPHARGRRADFTTEPNETEAASRAGAKLGAPQNERRFGAPLNAHSTSDREVQDDDHAKHDNCRQSRRHECQKQVV